MGRVDQSSNHRDTEDTEKYKRDIMMVDRNLFVFSAPFQSFSVFSVPLW